VLGSFEKEVEKHEEEFQEEDIRGFIDAFLLEMKNNKETFTVFWIATRFLWWPKKRQNLMTSNHIWSPLNLFRYIEALVLKRFCFKFRPEERLNGMSFSSDISNTKSQNISRIMSSNDNETFI